LNLAICNQSVLPDERTGSVSKDDFEAELAPLWSRARRGDEAAYRAALTIIATRLRRYYARRLASRPDATEDLVQETLLALHLKRGTHDPALPVSNWVHAIARYKLVDLWRSHGRHEALHESLDQFTKNLPAREPEALTMPRDMQLLLGKLPDAQRAAIKLIKLEGLTASEASRRTGVSVSALKVQVHRGLRRLSDLVGRPT